MKDFFLTEKELKDFHKNGYIGPFTLYDPNEMKDIFKQLRRQLLDTKNAVYQDENTTSGVTNLSNYDRHLDVPFLFDHIRKKEITDRICSILGKNILCWRTEFFPKYPGDEGTDWHQVKNFSAVSNSKNPILNGLKTLIFQGQFLSGQQ
jgi:non-heme Fe2+,alpha-ketoglutarate-dependent halogenase